jgi:hypothetical protein
MTDRFLRFTMNGMRSVDDYYLVSPYPSDWLNAVTYHYGLEWTCVGCKVSGMALSTAEEQLERSKNGSVGGGAE